MVFKRSAEQGNRFWLVLVEGRVLEGAEQRVRFWLGLYKDEDCFFYFFLSRWKGSERSRGNLRMVPPCPPFNVRQGLRPSR